MPERVVPDDGVTPGRRLLHDGWRRAALLAAIVGALGVAGLAVAVRGRRSTGFDDRVLRVLVDHLPGGWPLATLAVSTPAIPLVLLTVTAVAAARLRRLDLALLCLLGPGLAVALTQDVLKPAIGRRLAIGDVPGKTTDTVPSAFPSGHETLLAGAALVLLVAAGQLALRRFTRAVLVTVLAAWVVVGAAGLVVNFYHYASDTLGAFGVALVAVFATALVIDAVRPGARRGGAGRAGVGRRPAPLDRPVS